MGFAARCAATSAMGFTASRATTAMGFTASRATTAMGFTASRATAAAANASAASTAAAAETTRTFWRMGTIASLFSLRPARTFLYRMSSCTPGTIQYSAAWSTGQLFCDFSWRLRVFFGRIRRQNAHAAGPARNAGTFRFLLELLDRAGRDDPVLSPRRVYGLEWICV